MVSNSTQQLVLQVVDAQIDYRVKLLTVLVLVGYAFLGYYIKENMANDEWWKLLFKLSVNIYIFPLIFFLPLYIILLVRDYSYISMWTLILSVYSLIIALVFIGVMIFNLELILKIFNIDATPEALNKEKVYSYEKANGF